MRVVAYSTAEEYDLEAFREFIQNKLVYKTLFNSNEMPDALYLIPYYPVSAANMADILVFRDGSAVFWNIDDAETFDFIRSLNDFIKRGAYKEDLWHHESEEMSYMMSEESDRTRLSNGHFVLSEAADSSDTRLEKYALSNAMMLSVKLSLWESTLQEYVENIQQVTESLKRHARIRMSMAEVLRSNGQLFTLRHLINLSSDCLDTPDFYWERDTLARLYHSACNYLSIPRRTRVINERLSHCLELVEMLSSSLRDRQHVRLEYMIILLILLEVVFELLHFLRPLIAT